MKDMVRILSSLALSMVLLVATGTSIAQGQIYFSYTPYLGASPIYAQNLPKPPGATTQWLSFWMHSYGYIADAKSHIAVGLRGTAFAPAPHYFRGRGIIVGKSYESSLSGPAPGGHTLGGCLVGGPWTNNYQPQGIVQVETWNTDPAPSSAGKIFSDTCSPPVLQDNQWYQISVAANDAGWIAYDIFDINANHLWSYEGYFPIALSVGSGPGGLEPEGDGIFIVHDGQSLLGGTNDLGRSWGLNIAYISHGWY